MIWLLLVVSATTLTVENVGQDNPHADATMLLRTEAPLVKVGGVFGSEHDCVAQEAVIQTRTTTPFCVQAR